jgi:hypothetical protein
MTSNRRIGDLRRTREENRYIITDRIIRNKLMLINLVELADKHKLYNATDKGANMVSDSLINFR